MSIKPIPLKVVIPALTASLIVVALQLFAPDTESIPLEFPELRGTAEPINLSSTNYPLLLNVFGQVKPELATSIKSEVSGRVTKVADGLESGALFSKGDVLLQIDDTQYLEMLAMAEQQLAEALFQYARERALASQAKEDLSELPESSQSSLALRGPQLQAASKKVDAAKAKVKTAHQRLSMTIVKAPYDAYVSERSIGLGDLAEYGQALIEIFSGDSMLVTVQLSRKNLETLRIASQTLTEIKPKISVSIDGAEPLMVQAEVLNWGQVRNPRTQSQLALIRISNNRNDKALTLKPGSLLSMQVYLGLLEPVFHVDNNYIDGQTVAVASQTGMAHAMTVNVLSRTHSHAIVAALIDADQLELLPVSELPANSSDLDSDLAPGKVDKVEEIQVSTSTSKSVNKGTL